VSCKVNIIWNLKSFWKSWTMHSVGEKVEGTISLIISQKSACVMILRYIGARGLGNLCICNNIINARETYVAIKITSFLGKRKTFSCIFHPDNAKLRSACVTTKWLLLKWNARSSDLSPTENIWHIIHPSIFYTRLIEIRVGGLKPISAVIGEYVIWHIMKLKIQQSCLHPVKQLRSYITQ